MQGDFAGANKAFQPQAPIQAPIAPVIQPVMNSSIEDNLEQGTNLLDQIWGTK